MPPRDAARVAQTWNRKLHSYAGLSLLCFLWLFSLSGLILNHPTWEFAQFWPSRTQSSAERSIRAPPPGDPLSQARDLMAQIGVSGEIEGVAPRTGSDAQGLTVRVLKPGRITDVDADFTTGRARVESIQTNLWGVVHWLHHFTGVRMDRPELKRDWVVTRLWSLTMDAVCAGLILLVASSLYMWYPQMRKRGPGWVALGGGVLTCGFFVFGLAWLV